jgi:RNA polymerase sigma-70 factor, ECF subfamily
MRRLFGFGDARRIRMETFERSYTKYRDIVMRFAIRCIGRRDMAEELTAEAFLELHRHWQQIDTDRLPSWLFTVVKNRAADQLRRLNLEREYLSTEQPPMRSKEPEWERGLFDHEALKPVHRICLTLKYVHEMTLEEIAARLGITEVQVKGYLQYGRGLLRKQLSGKAGQ